MKLAWYEDSFGKDYMLVYKHRDFEGARREVESMMRYLSLRESDSVLDLCCGSGRHALTLAKLGFKVTGLDLSDILLHEAMSLDGQKLVNWHRGDMRRLPFADGSFVAVVNFFTSFGYFEEDEQNRLALLEIERVLTADGRFLIDFLNAEYVARNLVPQSERVQDGVLIRETRTIHNGYVQKQIAVGEGEQQRVYEEKVKLYRLSDFERLLKGSSLSIETVYGDVSGTAFHSLSSPRLILVGRKNAWKVEEH